MYTRAYYVFIRRAYPIRDDWYKSSGHCTRNARTDMLSSEGKFSMKTLSHDVLSTGTRRRPHTAAHAHTSQNIRTMHTIWHYVIVVVVVCVIAVVNGMSVCRVRSCRGEDDNIIIIVTRRPTRRRPKRVHSSYGLVHRSCGRRSRGKRRRGPTDGRRLTRSTTRTVANRVRTRPAGGMLKTKYGE